MKDQDLSRYWKKNIQYVSILLTIWFICSFGMGIIFVEPLNTIKIGGFPFGFWMAQQGAIYIFVVLIFVYVYLMNRLDKEFGVEED
ncbi:MAG: putative solute:sodium symporter small subunit [Saprospiraceae bacterium]|jgi:putative solute:sodium symporter small subunit